jgi:hypothetical protein
MDKIMYHWYIQKDPRKMSSEERSARIVELRKQWIKGEEAYDKLYQAAYKEWEANPCPKKGFNPQNVFVLVAIKEKIHRVIDELYHIEQCQEVPEG